jgi:peptidylprolyl isomerase
VNPVLRRSRRPALLLASALALATLSACGDDVVTAGGGGDTLDGFDAFSLSGDLGAPPKIDWKGQMDAGKIDSQTIIKGDGPELANGDKVLVNFTVGNGFTEEQTFTSYDEEPSGQLVTVDDQLSPLFVEAVTGQTVGSRVALVASAKEAFGASGNAQLGIGNSDPVLLVVDLSSAVLDKPSGTQTDAPAWAPSIDFEKGLPTKFDFSGTPEPTKALQKATLIKGDGPVVTSGQSIMVDYLGEIYGGDKPFDESYSKDAYQTGIGIGAVVKGWDEGLVGQTVGSRVILAIPPKLGYGEEGNEGAGISGTDTLYFVVDILAAG